MPETPADRLRIALELHEVGKSTYRMRLRRERPAATEAEIDAAVTAWLQRRPGAEFGDFPGPASSRRLA